MIKSRIFILCGWFLAFAGDAQTITNVIDSFSTNTYSNGSITNTWKNWFGGAFQSLSFDPTSSANGNPQTGSLKIVCNFPTTTDQFTVWNGITGISPALSGIIYTNLQCDIRFASGSVTNSSGNYGGVQFGMGTPSYGQDYWNSGFTVAAGNTNWVHVSIPLNVNTDTNLYNIANVFVHIWGAGLVGPSTLWVDNIQFVGMSTNTGTVTINYTNTQQRIDGFGASSAWMGSALSTSDANLLFSTNGGAGLSFLRTRIAPGGVIDDAEGTIAQEATARGARVWSTPWTPPAALKITNSWGTNAPLNGGWFSNTVANCQTYAADLANYVGHMQNIYGVSLYAVSVQNEPTEFVNYESCEWTSQAIHDFVTNLNNALIASNFTTTKIMLPEHDGWGFDLATNTMNDTTTSNLVGILASHNYGYAPYQVTQFGTPCPKPVWETEHYLGTDDSITNGLQLAQEIHTFMSVVQANAYHYWWLTGSGTGSIANNTANPAKRLFVMGNYSKFVRPNFYRVGLTNPTTALITAYKDSGSSNFVIVAANPTAITVNQTFVLTNFPAFSNVTPWVTSAALSLAAQPVISLTNSTFNYVLAPWTVVSFITASGGAIVLTNTDALNYSSFDWTNDSGGLPQANWSGGQWPTYLNDYYTGTNSLRTPASVNNLTFGGRSLTVQNPLGLFFKGINGSTITIYNLTLTNGGGICESLGSSSAFTLAGTLSVMGGQFYNSADATRTITNAATMSGIGALTNTGNGLVVYTGNNSAFTGQLVVNSNTTLQATSQNNLGGNPASFNAAQFVLDNGTFQPLTSLALTNLNSGITLNPGGGTFNIGSGITLTVSNSIAGTGSLLEIGSGTLILAGTNAFTGNTVVTNGKLALIGNADLNSLSLSNTVGTTLDISGLAVPLTISNRISLAGNLIVNADSTGISSKLIASNLVFGGSLTISNSGPAFAAGNSFTFFVASNYAGAFTNISPATPGAGLVWDTSKLVINGTLAVGVVPSVNISPASTNFIYGTTMVLTANVTGTGPLTYQWYDNHTNLIAGAVYASFTNTPMVVGSGNYTIITTNSVGRATNFTTVTVGKAALSVTANNTNRIYGVTNPLFTASFNGFVNGDTLSTSVTGVPGLSTAATSGSSVGNYYIVAANGTLAASNYTFGFNNGTLTINPATLNLTANNTNKVYGSTSVFAGTEFTVTGLTNSDVVSHATLASSGANSTALVGSYLITATNAVGTGLTNYLINYIPGTLMVVVASNTPPLITNVRLTGNNFIFSGTNVGTAGSQFLVLSSSNLALPYTNWTSISTNWFGSDGSFYVTNPWLPNTTHIFYILKLQ